MLRLLKKEIDPDVGALSLDYEQCLKYFSQKKEVELDIFFVQRGGTFINIPEVLEKSIMNNQIEAKIFRDDTAEKCSDGYGIVGDIYSHQDHWSERLDKLDEKLSIIHPLTSNLDITGLLVMDEDS